MYKNSLAQLHINKSRLNIRDKDGLLLSSQLQVGEVCKPLYSIDLPIPDFYIRGQYIKNIEKGFKDDFIITENGPHVLFINSIPKGFDIRPKLINGNIYSFEWEDRFKNILFQVCNIEKKYKVVSTTFNINF